MHSELISESTRLRLRLDLRLYKVSTNCHLWFDPGRPTYASMYFLQNRVENKFLLSRDWLSDKTSVSLILLKKGSGTQRWVIFGAKVDKDVVILRICLYLGAMMKGNWVGHLSVAYHIPQRAATSQQHIWTDHCCCRTRRCIQHSISDCLVR